MLEKLRRLSACDAQTRLIVSLAFLGLVLQLLLWQFDIRHWPLSGDERFYFESAKHIRKIFLGIIAGDHANRQMHIDAIVAYGWFLPGMPFLLQPALHSGWDLAQIRLYLLLINFALTLVITLRLASCLPGPTALLWLAIMCLFPASILFSATLWGEAIGGKLYLLLLIELYRALQRGGLKSGLVLPVIVGLALGAIIYIRPNFIILSPLLVFAVFYYRRQTCSPVPAMASAARFGVIAALITCVTLLPWQLAMYQKFGAFFLTTTSVDLNAIVAYTDKTYVYQSPSPDRKIPRIFSRTHAQISAEIIADAERSGESYGVALRQERKKILGRLTLERYINVTRESLFDFFCNENEFLFRFEKFSGNPAIKSFLYPALLAINTTLWYALLASTLAVLLLSLKSATGQWLFVSVKLSLLLLWVQPFISLSSGRYMIAFIPWMVLLVCLYAGSYYQQRIQQRC